VVDQLSRIVKAMPNVKGVRDEGTSRDGAARTVLILSDASFSGSGSGKTLVDNILLMTRIREESHKLPLRQAVAVAVGISGSTITTAGVILAGTFAVLAVGAGNSAGSDQVRQIGYGIAAGVLMDTFLIRTLLVPRWWPSRLSLQQGDVLEAGRTTRHDDEKAS
jgi:hypothetical protein